MSAGKVPSLTSVLNCGPHSEKEYTSLIAASRGAKEAVSAIEEFGGGTHIRTRQDARYTGVIR